MDKTKPKTEWQPDPNLSKFDQIRQLDPDIQHLNDDQLFKYIRSEYYPKEDPYVLAKDFGYELPDKTFLSQAFEFIGYEGNEPFNQIAYVYTFSAFVIFLVVAIIGYNNLKRERGMTEYMRPSGATNSQIQPVSVGYVNSYQRLILVVVIANIIVMFVYPPFQVIGNNGVLFNMGYGWIFDPPTRGHIAATVNMPMLLIQWVGVLVVGGLAFFLTKNPLQDSSSDCRNESATPSLPNIPPGKASRSSTLCEKVEINYMKTFGKIMAVIGILLVMVFAKGIGKMAGKSVVNNYDQGKLDGVIEKSLLEASKQINAQIPTMVDKETRLDATMCLGKHMFYNFTLVNLSEKDIDKNAYKKWVKSKMVKNLCSEEKMIKMLKFGVQYDYVYKDRDGNLLATVNFSKGDCGF